MSKGTTIIRCSVESASQEYADGRTRVALAVRPESATDAPKLRLQEGRIPITLSTKAGDFEAGIRARGSTNDTPYVCPDLRRKGTQERTTLAIVLEACGIPVNAIVDVAITGDTWKIMRTT